MTRKTSVSASARPIRWLRSAVIGLSLVATAHATEKCELPETIRFSMTPVSDVETEIRLYQPLIRRIETSTGRRVSIVRPGSYSSVIEGLLSGNIDIASIGPASYLEAKKGDDELTPFATIERQSGQFQALGPHYQSLLVVLTSSHYTSIDALHGARLALTDPASTSGSLLPRKRFAQQRKVTIDQFFGAISYSGSHTKSVHAILRGEADAAFISSDQLENACANGLLAPAQVRVLWCSEAIPYDPFVYRGQLCAPLRNQIRDAFFSTAAPAELKSILDTLHATRFIATDDRHYEGLRQIIRSE